MPSDRTFTFRLLTPTREIFSGQVTSVIFPAEKGMMGIWKNHAPFVGLVKTGPILARVWKNGAETKRIFFVSNGMAKIFHNEMVILADSAESDEQIDTARAERALQRAIERLSSHEPSVDISRAEQARKRAVTRLKIAHKRVFREE